MPIYQSTSFVFRDSEHAARLFALQEAATSTRASPTRRRPRSSSGSPRWKTESAGVAFASGQAAVSAAVFNLAGAGDHVVSAAALYGGTVTLFGHTFKKLGIDVTFVDGNDPEAFRRAITPRTRLLYAETVANPKLDTLDIRASPTWRMRPACR